MRWINVDDKYLDYLRDIEKRIPKTNYGLDKYKPFFGVLFEKDNLYYVTQVSHPQPRHYKLKQQKDFYKLYDLKDSDRLIAVINLNYMFPIPKECTSDFKKKEIHLYRTFFSEEEKGKYINLLDTELKAINALNLGEKALDVYNTKYQNPNDSVSKRCIDFKAMEKLAISYLKSMSNTTTVVDEESKD